MTSNTNGMPASLKKLRLQKARIADYCDQFLRKKHNNRNAAELERLRECWDMATAKLISLMQETAEAGMTEMEAQILLQQYKDEVLKRIMGKQYGNLG